MSECVCMYVCVCVCGKKGGGLREIETVCVRACVCVYVCVRAFRLLSPSLLFSVCTLITKSLSCSFSLLYLLHLFSLLLLFFVLTYTTLPLPLAYCKTLSDRFY